MKVFMKNIKRVFTGFNILNFEIGALIMLLIFLPSFEAPKNLFLICYVFFSLFRQFKTSSLFQIKNVDLVFFILFLSALLSTIFAGLHGQEWRGFRSFSTIIIFGWTLARSEYSKETIKILFLVPIFSLLPPLFFGLYEYLWIKQKDFLSIHSVGYVNASGVYIGTICGAINGYLYGNHNKLKKNISWPLLLFSFSSLFFLISLILGTSRSGFLLALFGTIGIIYFSRTTPKYKIISYVFLAVLIFVAFRLNLGVFLKNRNAIIQGNPIGTRFGLWEVCFTYLKTNLSFFGVGINNFYLINESLIKEIVEAKSQIYVPEKFTYGTLPHNIYLSFLLERGIFGLIALISFFLYWLKNLLNAIRKDFLNNSQLFILWSASATAFISIFFIGFFHGTFVHEQAILVLFFFGLYEAYSREILVNSNS